MFPSSLTNQSRARRGLAGAVPAAGTLQLRLLPNGDGWSLVGLDGQLVFSALGTSGRRQCLNYAAAHGVVTLAA
jgi:hypothetical protein